MTFDLILRNATLPDGRRGVDIGCVGGMIKAVGPALDAGAAQEIDVGARLVSPPFVDPHFHLDSALSLGKPRFNQSGTLLEGIAIWNDLKPQLTQDAILARAQRYCDLAIAQGLLAIRTHVDICDDRLLAVEALVDLRRRIKPCLDLQLVAFPQNGFLRYPRAAENLTRAMRLGIDVIGGIPHFERTMADGAASVRALCEIAAANGLPVDMHCDESDDPLSRHVETLAAETVRLGLEGRVTGSHLTSMHSMDNYYVSKLIPLMAEADLRVIANPNINITLQGRQDTYPKRRGMTRVAELHAAGLIVAFGQDCVMDPWYPLGSADMLDVAHMGLHVGQLTGRDAMKFCFDAVTANAAKIIGLEGYGLAEGCNADFVVLDAPDPVEALRLRATRLFVIRRGKIIARTPPRVTELAVEGRPAAINIADFGPNSG